MPVKGKLPFEVSRGVALPLITQIVEGFRRAIECGVYPPGAALPTLSEVAEAAGVSTDAVKNEVRKAYARRRSAERKRQERENLRPAIASTDAGTVRYDNVSSAAAEEGIVRLLVLDPSLCSHLNGMSQDDFTVPFLGKMAGVIIEQYASGRTPTVATLTSELEPNEASKLTEIMQRPENMAQREQTMLDYIEKIKTEKLKSTADNNLMALRDKLREKKGYKG